MTREQSLSKDAFLHELRQNLASKMAAYSGNILKTSALTKNLNVVQDSFKPGTDHMNIIIPDALSEEAASDGDLAYSNLSIKKEIVDESYEHEHLPEIACKTNRLKAEVTSDSINILGPRDKKCGTDWMKGYIPPPGWFAETCRTSKLLVGKLDEVTNAAVIKIHATNNRNMVVSVLNQPLPVHLTSLIPKFPYNVKDLSEFLTRLDSRNVCYGIRDRQLMKLAQMRAVKSTRYCSETASVRCKDCLLLTEDITSKFCSNCKATIIKLRVYRSYKKKSEKKGQKVIGGEENCYAGLPRKELKSILRRRDQYQKFLLEKLTKIKESLVSSLSFREMPFKEQYELRKIIGSEETIRKEFANKVRPVQADDSDSEMEDWNCPPYFEENEEAPPPEPETRKVGVPASALANQACSSLVKDWQPPSEIRANKRTYSSIRKKSPLNPIGPINEGLNCDLITQSSTSINVKCEPEDVA